MKYNDIYLVTKHEYAGFVEQIKYDTRDIKVIENSDSKEIQIFSKKTGKHLCSRICGENIKEQYYIFEFPDNDERCKPIPKMRINLETREEVQAFFNALKEIKENQND